MISGGKALFSRRLPDFPVAFRPKMRYSENIDYKGGIDVYHSRYHFENDCLHLAIDSLNGQILELADRRTGENLLKNAMFALPQPFTVRLRSNEGETELSPANVRDVHRHPDLRCEVSSCETADGLRVTVRYPCLWDGTTRYPLSLTYTATLCHNTIRWDCTVDNAGDHTVTQVRFPILNGIWLGDTWKDNVLYYPRFAGERHENPTAYLSAEPRIIQWRWQEYCYDYFVDSMWQDPALTARGLHGQALRYAGALSMSWMELDGPGQGFYFGCHDPEAKPCVLEAGAVGETRPGVCLAASFDPRVIPGDRWSTPPVMTRLHDGDWHRGAEYYRAFRAPLLSAPKARPHWMKNSRALFAHYDFKYQNGGVVHTYQDIPALARKAKEQGVCHLLLSGWHEDGFDCGFPQYVPDGRMALRHIWSFGGSGTQSDLP